MISIRTFLYCKLERLSAVVFRSIEPLGNIYPATERSRVIAVCNITKYQVTLHIPDNRVNPGVELDVLHIKGNCERLIAAVSLATLGNR